MTTALPLSNKTALITGASQRLGAATARKLHENGADVIIHYNQSKAPAEKLVAQLNALRPNSAHCLPADLNDPAAVTTLAQNALAIDPNIHILINNASSFYATPFGTANDNDWHDLFNSNAKAPYFLSQQLSETLKTSNGVIINMIDIHAQRPLNQYTIYSMAKSSLATLTKALAKELAPDVRVNGVAPGAILWPDNASPEDKKSILKEIPLGRLGSSNDIANTILFLIMADYITGQIIAVDGGRSL
ncbi:MAG: pteridine reductase [Gammaproteobacteria bacterium]|nr:MAG: pteridine reductase [Gammaproteobacteria bacterium]